jgi:hypothetical protein
MSVPFAERVLDEGPAALTIGRPLEADERCLHPTTPERCNGMRHSSYYDPGPQRAGRVGVDRVDDRHGSRAPRRRAFG